MDSKAIINPKDHQSVPKFLREICDEPEPDEAPRDYLNEAFAILGGRTLYLAQREHLLALDAHYQTMIAEYCRNAQATLRKLEGRDV